MGSSGSDPSSSLRPICAHSSLLPTGLLVFPKRCSHDPFQGRRSRCSLCLEFPPFITTSSGPHPLQVFTQTPPFLTTVQNSASPHSVSVHGFAFSLEHSPLSNVLLVFLIWFPVSLSHWGFLVLLSTALSCVPSADHHVWRIVRFCAKLCPTLWRPQELQPARLLCPWNFHIVDAQ